jgi:hypothetical protein
LVDILQTRPKFILIPTFRSSCFIAAPSSRTSKSHGTSKPVIPVPRFGPQGMRFIQCRVRLKEK